MPGRQAKIITPTMLRRMLGAVAGRQTTSRDRVIILLSVKAGLRACEIARLDWSMVLDARGRVADSLAVRDAIAKKRGGRRIPMHPSLGRALVALKRASAPAGPVVRSARGGGMRPKSIVNWFAALFASLELEGCSSHSGPPQLHYGGGAKRAQDRLQPARRSIAGRSQVDRDHAGLYRRRHARAAAPGGVALARARFARTRRRGVAKPEPSRREQRRNPDKSVDRA